MNVEKYLNYVIPTSRPAKIIFTLAVVVYVDLFFLQWGITQFFVLLATEYESVITLIFSGLLVLLYWEQHRVQSKQADILQRQALLTEVKQKPSIELYDWEVEIVEEDIGEIPGKFLITRLDLENLGGRVNDVKITGEIYFGLSNYKYPILGDEVSFFFQRAGLFEQEHNVGQVGRSTDGISIPEGKAGTYHSAIPIRSHVTTGSDKVKEDVARYSLEPLENVGDINNLWSIDVSSIIVSLNIIARDLHEEEYKKEILTAEEKIHEDLTIDEILKQGNPVGKPRKTLSSTEIDDIVGLSDMVV
mgnify:CR=1 FL=1